MTRRMSASRKVRIFAAHGGICHICGQPIDGTREQWEAEHIVPYALTRDDSDENLAPAHKKCHAQKTPSDVKAIAKAKRVHGKHIGAKPKPVRPIPGSRVTKFKRTIYGRTVRRDE